MIFCKLWFHLKCVHKTSSLPLICHFQKNASTSLLLPSVRCISSVAGDNEKSFIVSYLTNDCGLSPKSALSASKYLHFQTPVNPDSVLSFLRSHGFSESQITKIIQVRPRMLASNPEKTLLPKIQFFHSKEFSTPDIAKILSVCPDIMHISLENQLIPSYYAIQSLVPSHEKLIGTIKSYPSMLLRRDQNRLFHNMKMLKHNGLSPSNIVWLLTRHPRVLMRAIDRFAEIIEEVKRMGIKPSGRKFVIVMKVKFAISKSMWKRKLEVFRKWGWSQQETTVALWNQPLIMMTSEKKIMQMMDYYINQMGWNSSLIAQHPILICLSLEKRVVPRCSVLQVLLTKDLIRLTTAARSLKLIENLFFQKFVTPFEEEAPHLLKLYQEKLNIAKCEGKETG